jgi:MoxR-like ATPase
MSSQCLNNGECGQYCQVLNALTEETSNSPCEWPVRLDEGYNLNEAAQPQLAQRTGNHLLQILAKGDRIRTLLETPGTEQAVAYQVNHTIFDAQLELWKSYATAASANRLITDVEVDYYTDQLQQSVIEAQDSVRKAGVSPENLTYAQAIHDRETLEDHGLLFDEGMLQTVTQLCANAASGRSTLLVGDKGIAKTQAAKFTSKLFAPDDKPRFISGDGSMMKDEFIGKMTLTEKNGATVTTFQPGILTECMKQGIPLVMDEINLIDPAIAMRLQDILLRKPGDTVTIQEDGGEAITIKRGFCVLATANEASSRYQSRAALDPAFRDRFNILPIEYPDGETTMLQANERPAALARLSYAFAVSRSGIANSRITPDEALWLASISHASQQLYSKPAKDVNTGRLGSRVAGVVDDAEPRMTDCITPRKMVDILQTVGGGLNPYDVASGIKGVTMDTIAAMQHSEDRQTMFEIIRLMHDGPINDFNEAEVRKRLKV